VATLASLSFSVERLSQVAAAAGRAATSNRTESFELLGMMPFILSQRLSVARQGSDFERFALKNGAGGLDASCRR